MHHVFVTGGTGYLGRSLIPRLLERGHRVGALVREGSEKKIPSGCRLVTGNALDKKSFVKNIAPADTFLQLVGVAHPSPSKEEEFKTIDLASLCASVAAATESGIKHFVYLSVAQPSSYMKGYVAVREEGERLVRSSGMDGTFLRPWYVLGPGHRWPYALVPMYWVLEALPSSREKARRFGLVNLEQMIAALAGSIENPPEGIRILEVPEIKRAMFSS